MTGMGYETSLSQFSMFFIQEAQKAGYTDPLNCKVIAVSTTEIKPKIAKSDNSNVDKDGRHHDKEGYMLGMIILVMGMICMCHIITDNEKSRAQRYQRIPKSILGELSKTTTNGMTSWAETTELDLGDDIELRNYSV